MHRIPSLIQLLLPLAPYLWHSRSSASAFAPNPKTRTAATRAVLNHRSTRERLSDRTCTNHPSSLVVLSGGYNMDISQGSTQGSYWNRETSTHGDGVSGKVIKEARIICLSDPDDADNDALYNGELPEGSRILAIGSSMDDFDIETLKAQEPNVLYVSHPASREPLARLLETFPTVEWVQARSAGIDFITSDGLAAASHVTLTNAKGCFSSTLAEYTMMACAYFAKDLPRLMRQKRAKDWDKYDVLELRGSTLGIIGYGDIGRATAKLADAYGMRVVALRRNPKRSLYDPYCKEMYGMDGLKKLMSESDYVLVAAPLTEDTRGLVNADVISHAKQDAILINVGRGPIIDEEAMIGALKDGTLKGAALDVTTIEPLPEDSPLWELDNVLLSPHNMDKTTTFLSEATAFFVDENLVRFVRDKELLNPVDKKAGY